MAMDAEVTMHDGALTGIRVSQNDWPGVKRVLPPPLAPGWIVSTNLPVESVGDQSKSFAELRRKAFYRDCVSTNLLSCLPAKKTGKIGRGGQTCGVSLGVGYDF